jgi:hypothetical protein
MSLVLPRPCSAIQCITAALASSACVVGAPAQSDSPAFAKFKREMMPKVGQKITVVGTSQLAKKAGSSVGMAGIGFPSCP